MYQFLSSFLILVFSLTSMYSFAQVDTRAESVEYYPAGNTFYSSTGVNATISQISPDGSEVLFGKNLWADLGMEIIGDLLFAITPGANTTDPAVLIKAFDLTTQQEVMSYTVVGAQNLNGMASDGISMLWCTDFFGNAIYSIDVSDISQPQSTQIATTSVSPNGITHDADNNRLVFVSWNGDNNIRQLDLSDNSISIVLSNTDFSFMDGIDMDIAGNFYVSTWMPNSRITKFNNDFSTSEMINVPGMTNPADICIANEISMLAIPSFQHDVILHPLSPTTSIADVELLDNDKVKIYPNMTAQEQINIDIDINLEWKEVAYNIYNTNGRLVLKGESNDNLTQVDISNFQQGMYFIQFMFDGKSSTTKSFNKL